MAAKVVVFLAVIFFLVYIFYRNRKRFFCFNFDNLRHKKEASSFFAKSRIKLFQAKKVFCAEPFDFDIFLRLDVPEITETMDEQQRPLVQEALKLIQERKEESLKRVLDISENLKNKYPRFYFGYYLASLANQYLNEIPSSKAELEKGIKLCNQKYTLYAAMGSLAYDTGDINHAVAWWIKSIVAQVSIGRIELAVPFIFVGYVARYFKLHKIESALLDLAAKAEYKQGILNERTEEKLFKNLKEKGAESIHRALVLLYAEHISRMIY